MAVDKVYEASSIILATGVKFGKTFKSNEEFIKAEGEGNIAAFSAVSYLDKKK